MGRKRLHHEGTVNRTICIPVCLNKRMEGIAKTNWSRLLTEAIRRHVDKEEEKADFEKRKGPLVEIETRIVGTSPLVIQKFVQSGWV